MNNFNKQTIIKATPLSYAWQLMFALLIALTAGSLFIMSIIQLWHWRSLSQELRTMQATIQPIKIQREATDAQKNETALLKQKTSKLERRAAHEKTPAKIIDAIITAADVHNIMMKHLSIKKDAISLSAQAADIQNTTQLVEDLKQIPHFEDVTLVQMSNNDNKMHFDIKVQVKKQA